MQGRYRLIPQLLKFAVVMSYHLTHTTRLIGGMGPPQGQVREVPSRDMPALSSAKPRGLPASRGLNWRGLQMALLQNGRSSV